MLHYMTFLVLLLIKYREFDEILTNCIMFIIIKHFVTVNSFSVEKVVPTEQDAVALVNILNQVIK